MFVGCSWLFSNVQAVKRGAGEARGVKGRQGGVLGCSLFVRVLAKLR